MSESRETSTSSAYSVATSKLVARYLDDLEALSEALSLINWENIDPEERQNYWNAIKVQSSEVNNYATFVSAWLEKIGT